LCVRTVGLCGRRMTATPKLASDGLELSKKRGAATAKRERAAPTCQDAGTAIGRIEPTGPNQHNASTTLPTACRGGSERRRDHLALHQAM
jgi:hypothetical protein